MKNKILDLIKTQYLFFDGGTGTYLQKHGLPAGYFPEKWNIEKSEEIINLHFEYLKAGANILKTNTFGANGFKFLDEITTSNPDCKEFSLQEIVSSAMNNAKKAIEKFSRFSEKNCFKDKTSEEKFIALDIGPIAKLLEPMGDLSFEKAVSVYSEIIKVALPHSPDLILFETFTDSYSLKAGIVAAKEVCDIPIFATVALDEMGRLLTGADIKTVATLLEGLGVQALGFNCGLGPFEMQGHISTLLKETSLPIILNPNAGMPSVDSSGNTFYNIEPKVFANKMTDFAKQGINILGGCCGTTPEFICELVKTINADFLNENKCCEILSSRLDKKSKICVCSGLKTVEIKPHNPVLIGERINPTGKPKFKQALRDENIQYILAEGIKQEDAGVQILDVNVGLPEINEEELLQKVIKALQGVVQVPLQIDTSNIAAMEKAMRIYNGIPLINSVNGKDEVMDSVFPLVKKYGGVVVGLTLDKGGIPEKAAARVDIARHILKKANEYKIAKKNIVIDPLCLAVSSGSCAANTTLEALSLLDKEIGCPTVLGVSNVSFGLPRRELINSTFFTMALHSGLAAGIINPFSQEIMNSYYAFRALTAVDLHCEKYIQVYANTLPNQLVSVPQKVSVSEDSSLQKKSELYEAVVKGLQELAKEKATLMLNEKKPLEIIQEELIPALDYVGKLFEKGKFFLPQLLMSADSSQAAFSVLKAAMEKTGEQSASKGTIIVATVEGDVHDIGKNIVKTLLENFGFSVIDLGKDVSPELIVNTVKEKNVRLVGLSALMTTTVPAMQKTIELLRQCDEQAHTTVVVGGAVLTEEYATMIGADKYCKDAMATVSFAEEFFSKA